MKALDLIKKSQEQTCRKAIERAMKLYFDEGKISYSEYVKRIDRWNEKLKNLGLA